LASYLIGCSKSKNRPIIRRRGDLCNLAFNNELGRQRFNLIRSNPQIQLDWEYTLPAWELYSGPKSRLYSRVLRDNWQKEDAEVYILSALFGWIRHTDLIPFYDLAMSDGILHYKNVSDYWKESGSLGIIPNNSVDLLSKVYRQAVNGHAALTGNLGSQNWRDNYGYHKGEWLNQQLNLLT